MNNPVSRIDKIFLVLTIFFGIIAVIPQVFYQPYLLQGDHGRDLYVFQQTSQGAIPYFDYRTDNGPLMPFYYGACLRYFGNSINSVLIGYALMIFCAGFLLYLIARKIIAPPYAFLCALWYWAWRGQEFFYTFNHIGAVVAGLATLLCTLVSITHQRKRYFILAFFSAMICMGVRPDIGLASLAGLLIATFIYQRKNYLPQRSFFVITLTFFGGMFVLIHLFIPEMFAPYWRAIHWNHIIENIVQLCTYGVLFCTQNVFIGSVSILMIILTCLGFFQLYRERRKEAAQNAISALVCFTIFFILFFMEYLLGFRFFRWVWVLPFFFLILFTGVYSGVKKLKSFIQHLICATFIFVCCLMLFLNYQDIAAAKKDGIVLRTGKTEVFMAKDQKPWIETVQNTTQYILNHTSPDDEILTLPYDAIYCFLSGRKLAVPNPSLFGTSSDYVIPDLESKHVSLIVVSNRAFRHNEEGLFGTLGKDYGVNLWDYIRRNYRLAVQFGPWNDEATPIRNHATQIYTRITPFKKVSKVRYETGDEL